MGKRKTLGNVVIGLGAIMAVIVVVFMMKQPEEVKPKEDAIVQAQGGQGTEVEPPEESPGTNSDPKDFEETPEDIAGVGSSHTLEGMKMKLNSVKRVEEGVLANITLQYTGKPPFSFSPSTQFYVTTTTGFLMGADFNEKMEVANYMDGKARTGDFLFRAYQDGSYRLIARSLNEEEGDEGQVAWAFQIK